MSYANSLVTYNFSFRFAATCMVTSSEVSTFDDETHVVELGNCWHLMVTTKLQSTTTIPLVSIKKDEASDYILANVILANGSITYNFRIVEEKLVVLLKEKQIISSARPSTYRGNGLTIYSTNAYLRLVTDDNNFELVHYKKIIQTKVSKKKTTNHSNKPSEINAFKL